MRSDKIKPDWLKVVSFKTELLSEYLIHKGYREDLPKLLPRIGFLRNRMIIDNDIYVDLNEVNVVSKILSEDLIAYASEAYSVIEAQSLKLLATAKKVKQEVVVLSNNDLSRKLKAFFVEYQKALGAIGIPTIIDLTIESKIREHLKSSGIENIDEAFGKLAIPEKSIATNQELLDLMNIAIKKNTNQNTESLIREHNQKYGWLHSTLFLGDEYTVSKITDEINSISNPIKEKERIINERNMQIFEAEKVIDYISSDEGKSLARFFQKAVYFRTARLEWINQACFAMRPVMNEIASRLKINFDDLIYLYPEEIYKLLSQPSLLNKEVINERKKGYAFISDDSHEYALFTGQHLMEWKEKFSVKIDTGVIKGIVACKGKVRGRVVLMKDRSELSKIHFGDIIVTPLTTPDFVVAMKKSSAIVTDLGGMTSHAAIVSRELGIPCIVGTKNATRILKDGDMVEVDANNGVVNILK
jgi:phosphoenolpyruvate synthase/pyruvate phosphate dikinase